MKRVLFAITILVLPLKVYSQEFGRLFTSTAERRSLDALRANEVPQVATPRPTEVIEEAPVTDTLPVELNFSGFIRRADGTYAIWVNGKSALSKTNSPIDQAQFQEELPYATLQVDRKQASMKPGQIWSLGNNTIREGYYAKRAQKPTPNSTPPGPEEFTDTPVAAPAKIPVDLETDTQTITTPITEGQ